ncbi:hypothetical protein [Nonomuraea lactucae]|uniref:hypothetical protein n=1 Tax=Nonomuraea lactucae TaxID=2249762 RepID=UPI003B82DD19
MDRVFRLHVDPILGHLRMAEVRPSHIRAWVKDRTEVLSLHPRPWRSFTATSLRSSQRLW